MQAQLSPWALSTLSPYQIPPDLGRIDENDLPSSTSSKWFRWINRDHNAWEALSCPKNMWSCRTWTCLEETLPFLWRCSFSDGAFTFRKVFHRGRNFWPESSNLKYNCTMLTFDILCSAKRIAHHGCRVMDDGRWVMHGRWYFMDAMLLAMTVIMGVLTMTVMLMSVGYLIVGGSRWRMNARS